MDFSCLKCGHSVSIPDELAGKQVKCPKCGQVGPAEKPAGADGLAALEKAAPAAPEPPPRYTGLAAIWFSLPTAGQYALLAGCVLVLLALGFAIVWKATDGFGSDRTQLVKFEPPPIMPPPHNAATSLPVQGDWQDEANKELDVILDGLQKLKKTRAANLKSLDERAGLHQQAVEQAQARSKAAAEQVAALKAALTDLEAQEKNLRIEAEQRKVRSDVAKSLLAAADKDIAALDAQLRKADPARRAELANEQLLNRQKRQSLEKEMVDIAKGEGKLEELLDRKSARQQGLAAQQAVVDEAEKAIRQAKMQLVLLEQLRLQASVPDNDLDQRYHLAVESLNRGQRPRELPAIRVQIDARQAEQADLLKDLPPTTMPSN